MESSGIPLQMIGGRGGSHWYALVPQTRRPYSSSLEHPCRMTTSEMVVGVTTFMGPSMERENPELFCLLMLGRKHDSSIEPL